MGDVRTERGDLVPEKIFGVAADSDEILEAGNWKEMVKAHPVILHLWNSRVEAEDFVEWRRTKSPAAREKRIAALESELASWQARAEAAEKLATHLDQLQSDYAQKYCAETASRLQWQARAEQARNEALEEAARECEEFAAYYAPEFMAAPFPEGYVFKPEETRAAMHFAHGRFRACASKLRAMIVSDSAAWKKDAEDKDALIAELSRPQWISVEEQLPEPGVNVLAIAHTEWRTSEAYTVYRTEPMTSNGELWTWRDSHLGSQEMWFTHWMPIPPPPGAIPETKDGVVSRSTDLEGEDGKK